MRKNKRGDNGHPCVRPCSTLKIVDATPLISMLYDADVKQHMIHFMIE